MSSRNQEAHRRTRKLIIMTCVVGLLVAAGAVMAGTSGEADGRKELRVVQTGESGLIFSSWQESGRRWVSVSKDGGDTWSEPRAMVDEIPLAAGIIVPGVSAPIVPENLGAGEKNRVFLVQFETRSLVEWRRQLRGLGAEVLSYVPHNSHLVRMDPELVSQVEAKPFVRWVGAYEPFYRASPGLMADLRDGDARTRRFLLRTYLPGPDDKARLALEIRAVGGRVDVSNPGGYIVEATLTDAQALDLLPSNHLQWIDEWSAPQDDMDNGRIMAGADYVLGTPGVYDGTGVRAEVMDGNVLETHSDLGGILLHGSKGGDASHGTPTYGINFGDGTGDARATGMVPGAQGYFADYDYLSDRNAHTAELVNPALDYKCVYQSNSWGSDRTFFYNAISAQMDDIIWQYDIAIFQSQSNAGDQDSRPQAWAKNIISVGGAYHNNNINPDDDSWSSGASTGPADDGRVKPDLTFFYDRIMTTSHTGGYDFSFGGTSGATPMVAGTSGLFFQMWADNLWGTAPGAGTVFDERPHSSTMKALLINTAVQYDWNTTNFDITRFRQGWGYPNAQNAYDRAPLTSVIDETSVLQELDKDTYTAIVPAAQGALKATLVYTDRAGVPGSMVHRINDVTLKVIAPGGTIYWGNNGLTESIWSTSGGAADTINTVENVFIQNPASGTWTFEVEAVEVNMDVHVETPEDDQDYALVVYGVTGFSGGDLGAIFSDGFESGDTTAWFYP